MSVRMEEARQTRHAVAIGPDQPEDLGPSTPAGQVVLAYLQAQADSIRDLEPMVRADEPDAAHQMRVAVRRLRGGLRTFRGVIERPAGEELAGELRWLGALLGRVRDAEVLAAHLRGALHEIPVEQNVGPVEARVQAHFASARAAAHADVLAGLDSARYPSLLGALDRFIARPPFTPAAALPARDVLPAAVRRAYRQVKRRVRRVGHTHAGPGRDVALHQARKAVRRARYAGEAAAPALGRKPGKFAKRMKRLQSALGEHQDTVIAREVTRELGMRAHLAGENAYTYGLLHARDTCAARRHQAQARKAWHRASRPRYRRWLGNHGRT
jgi:CHAD domain-containing protein